MKEKDYSGDITEEWLLDERSSTVSLHLCRLSSAWSGEPDEVRPAFSRLSRMNLQEYTDLRGVVRNRSCELSMPPLRPKDSFVKIFGSSAKGGPR